MPETAFDKGSESDFKAERMPFEPATKVSPQSPSPAMISLRWRQSTNRIVFGYFWFCFDEGVGGAFKNIGEDGWIRRDLSYFSVSFFRQRFY